MTVKVKKVNVDNKAWNQCPERIISKKTKQKNSAPILKIGCVIRIRENSGLMLEMIFL